MIPGRREVVLEGKLRPVTEKHHLKDGEMEPGIDLTPLSIVGWETEAAACTNAPTPTLSTQPQPFHTLHSSAVPRMHPPSNFLPQILLYCVQPVPLQCQCAGPTDPTGDIWACLQVLPLLNIPRAPVGRQEEPSPKRPHEPFSKVATPHDFLSPVSGMCPSATRRARGTVASLAAGSQLRVPMVSRASCGLLRLATLVPQARHCPQSSQLSRCWQKPGLTTPFPPHRRPLVPKQGSQGLARARLVGRTLAWKWS